MCNKSCRVLLIIIIIIIQNRHHIILVPCPLLTPMASSIIPIMIKPILAAMSNAQVSRKFKLPVSRAPQCLNFDFLELAQPLESV